MRHRRRWVVFFAAVIMSSVAIHLPGASGAQSVPAPFTPLRTLRDVVIEQGSRPSLKVESWGRIYRFQHGPLPVQIVSQGSELLAAEPRWKFVLEDGPARLDWSRTEIESENARRVTLVCSAALGVAHVRARTVIEYDGMIRVDLEIVGSPGSDAVLTLRQLQYEIPLRADVARWFNHHVPYDYRRLTIDKQALISSVGAFPENRQSFEFVPTLFLGNYDVGLEWWSDENVNWRTAEKDRPIELERRGNQAILRVTPVSAPIQGVTSFRHRFALFPAPMRPSPPRWRSNRFISPSAHRSFEKDGFRYFWIAFPGHIFPHYHGLPATPQTVEQVALRERLRQQGVRYIPYGKLMAAPSFHPKTLAHGQEWAANRRMFTGPTAAEQNLMRRNTSWKRGEWYGYNVCARRTDYFDWILAENLEALRAEDLDGIYFDFGSPSSPCETDPRLEPGAKKQAWHYFEIREFYKGLYEGVDELNPEALITIHTNGQPRALTAWVDYNFVGEAVNAVFRDGRRWPDLKKRPELYDSDYGKLPSLFLIAQTLPNIGGVTSILPQLHKAQLDMDPAKLIRFQRGFLSQVLVNDTHFWFANMHHPSLVDTIAALDRFGSLDDATFEPWWRPKSGIEHGSELKVSLYRRADAVLAIVANWTSHPIAGELHVRSDILNSEKAKWSDPERPSAAPTDPTDGTIRITVQPHDFRLIMLQ